VHAFSVLLPTPVTSLVSVLSVFPCVNVMYGRAGAGGRATTGRPTQGRRGTARRACAQNGVTRARARTAIAAISPTA
jgi:hypothetical protein